MQKNKIIRLGNPLLRLQAEAIAKTEFGSALLKELEQELFDVMHNENGLGLAAPQIGVSKQVMVFGMEQTSSLPVIPFTAIFNPTFEPITDICVDDYEGCLSVGELRGKVSRYQSIRYRGYDVNGALIEREVSDLHARVFQHEFDHLKGILFLDKITDHNSLGFHNELVRTGKLKPR